MVNEETHVKNGVSLTGAATGHAASNGQGSGTGVGGQPGSESSEDEREGRIRVGREYQAVPPPCLPPADRRPDLCPERALLVWSPNHSITTKRLDEFVQVAKDKYSYNVEQALGMLFWHKHDLERAMQDLANFTPFPDEWSVEDKVLFEQAFQFHGKSFHRIRQMLPDKSIAALVKYYYSWKKTRTRTSLMDRQAKKLQAVREEGRYDDLDQFGEGDEDSQGDKEVSARGREEGGELWQLRDSVSPDSFNAQGEHVRDLSRLLGEDGTIAPDDGTAAQGRTQGHPQRFQELYEATQGDAYQSRRFGGPSYGSERAGGGGVEVPRHGDTRLEALSAEQQTAPGNSPEKNQRL
eukprot:TRINITY_DN1251_c0_g1_i11.p1 TRINITY_DN1251_c0_g1~~TRINITY_DN1251_c0_g1_i11.p1  ORF type:complete len:351 (-),score=62.54 TRINITY_DN1251_c0_g1_i11:1029-2081(-)